MRAPEHNRFDLLIAVGCKQRGQIIPQRRAVQIALFDKLHQPRAGQRNNAAAIAGHQLCILLARDCSRRCQRQHQPVRMQLGSRLKRRLHPDNRQFIFRAQRRRRRTGRRIAGDYNGLYPPRKQRFYHLPGQRKHFPAALGAVGRMRRIAIEQKPFLRQQSNRLAQHADSAHAAVKNADRHLRLPVVPQFLFCGILIHSFSASAS